MEKDQSKRLTASEAKAQTKEFTIDEILKSIDANSKAGDCILLIHPNKYVSPFTIAELMRLEYKCYEFKDNVIGLNGLAIEWK